MAASLFIYSLNLNIVLIWVILALIIFRLLSRKVSKQLCYLLWGILAVKCLLPVSVGSIFSFIPVAEYFNVNDFHTFSFQIPPGLDVIDSIEGLCVTWILGIIVLLSKLLFDVSRLKEELSTAVRYEENIWQSDIITSPLVYGIIKPKIYIPFNMEPEKLRYAVLHEKEHIRQWDHIWKFTAHIILILNWYNPFMWLAYKKFADDIELACDERVVRNLNNEERKNYALTLMDYSSNKYVSLGKSLYFGRENTKKRIINVLNYKKPIVFIV